VLGPSLVRAACAGSGLAGLALGCLSPLPVDCVLLQREDVSECRQAVAVLQCWGSTTCLSSPTLCVLTTVCIYVRFTLAKRGLHPYVWCSLVHARLLIKTHTRAGNFRFACNLAIDDERRLIITKKAMSPRRGSEETKKTSASAGQILAPPVPPKQARAFAACCTDVAVHLQACKAEEWAWWQGRQHNLPTQTETHSAKNAPPPRSPY